MPSTRTRLIPRGLLGMLVLVALVERSVVRSEVGINGIEPWDWRQTGRAAAGSASVRDASVLCLGDSLVKLGVRPGLVEAGLGAGRKVYNLALCAGRAPSSYFLLRRALAAGARPEALVVDFNDTFLAEPPETTTRLYAELLRPGEARELAGVLRRPDFAATILTFQALPSARNRFEVRRAIGEAFAGHANFEGRKANTARRRRSWAENAGAQVMPRATNPLPDDPAAWAWVGPSGWRPDPTNAAYLTAFFELAEARSIPVFWLLPPLHPGYSARRAELALDAPFDAFVAGVQARFPRVVVVDGRGARYDRSVFVDMAHLDVAGSARLSADLATVVTSTLERPGPRVVALPAFEAPQIAADGAPIAR